MAGRFESVSAPKHGSWLNLVEGIFSKLKRQMFRVIRVADREERIKQINKYIEGINDSHIVYHWK
jgi:transposase